MAKQIITITEDKLKRIVNKTVKKVLNEISIGLGYRAYDAALNQGRTRQAQNMYANSTQKLCNFLNVSNTSIIDVDYKHIKFTDTLKRSDITLTPDGIINVAGSPIAGKNKVNVLDVPHFRCADKNTARVIAKWASIYMDREKLGNAGDWHFWAKL